MGPGAGVGAADAEIGGGRPPRWPVGSASRGRCRPPSPMPAGCRPRGAPPGLQDPVQVLGRDRRVAVGPKVASGPDRRPRLHLDLPQGSTVHRRGARATAGAATAGARLAVAVGIRPGGADDVGPAWLGAATSGSGRRVARPLLAAERSMECSGRPSTPPTSRCSGSASERLAGPASGGADSVGGLHQASAGS
jgi:hypothetical protein